MRKGRVEKRTEKFIRSHDHTIPEVYIVSELPVT